MIESLAAQRVSLPPATIPTADQTPVIHRIPASADQVEVAYRRDGDKYLLVEYGPPVLDLNLRFRVHALMEFLQVNPLPSIDDIEVPTHRASAAFMG
jgi:urea carboxylase